MSHQHSKIARRAFLQRMGQLQHDAAVLGTAPQLARLGQRRRLAGFGAHGFGAVLHALLQRGQIGPPLTGLGHQIGLLGGGLLNPRLERGDGIALVG